MVSMLSLRSDNGVNTMDKETIDLHHLSAIRVGDRIIYNGVGGDAFSFGEKPDLAAFALGPYPKPTTGTPQLPKSHTEPSLKTQVLNEGPESKGTDINLEEDRDSVKSETPRPHEAIPLPPPPDKSSASPADHNNDSVQQPATVVPNQNSSSSLSSTTSSSSKKKKPKKARTLKEVALEAEINKAAGQHNKTGSWSGAITNLSSKLVNSTSVLMTYTAAATMNVSQKAIALPPPPGMQSQQPQPLPPPPEEKSAPASKNSSSSESSKSSMGSSSQVKLRKEGIPGEDSLADKHPRPMSLPPPAAVGLPPVLPRPPAAHLPPPLPSRPPSALLPSGPSSPCSSIKSSVSQRPSPDDDTDMDDSADQDFDDTTSNKSKSFIYRSSGTIRVEDSHGPPSSPPPASSSNTSTPSYVGSGQTRHGRRLSQPSTATMKNTTDHSKKTNVPTISAMVVGSPGTSLATDTGSESKTPQPSPLLSHVYASTPNLRSPPSDVSSVHSSDDEGVFEGANSSDTLSASDNETAAPVTPIDKGASGETSSKRQQKKKLTKQQSLDATGFSKKHKKSASDTRGIQRETYDETVMTGKKRWFFHRKGNQAHNGEENEKSPSSADIEMQDRNGEGKINEEKKPPDPPPQKAAKQHQKKKSLPKAKIKLDNAPNCRKCRIKFGFRFSRQHCHRCKLAFCNNCAPVTRCDLVSEDLEQQTPSLVKLCAPCKDELLFENSRGATRGLWSEFQKMRAEARDNRGLDVCSSTLHKHLESQTVLDVTPGLRNLCIKFLVDLHQQLQKQPRHKFLANYLHFENPIKQQSGNAKKVKNCHSCDRYLRITSDIRECGICKQVFCMACTWKTLQVFLPKGTDLRGDIQLEMIKFYVKETEVMGKGEVTAIEASEVYRVCASCEDVVCRNIHVYDFDAKMPELEAELFDLQRQIDHSLTFSPYMLGMQRSVSTAQLKKLDEENVMSTCVKHANRLYERYTRAYEILSKLRPQTGGQKALHKHVKQAMYDFYLKRRDQLQTTLKRRDSSEDIPAEGD